MSRIFLFIGLACLVGCSSKAHVGKKPERYLYFTSNFPSSVYWEISTQFTSTNESRFCKDFSMGHGGWVHKIRYEQYFLKKSGDTLKIPLFWTKASLCDWKMEYVSTNVNGQCIHMSRVGLRLPNTEDALTGEWSEMPKVISYTCTLDSSSHCLECDTKKTTRFMHFFLNEKTPLNYLGINLGGFN